jgi:hypothetical protein
MTTIYLLAEQVILNLKGGKYQVASSIQIEDVIAYMKGVLPSVIKQEWFQMTQLPEGETLPPNLYFVLHENVAVLNSGKRWYSKLPVIPIGLPRNMGVFSVFNPEEPDCEFVPVFAGMRGHIMKSGMLADLFGQVGYEVNSGTVEYFRDPGVQAVSMKLLAPDISGFGEFDPLPIGLDHETQLINTSFDFFSRQRPPGVVLDPTVDTQFRKQ